MLPGRILVGWQNLASRRDAARGSYLTGEGRAGERRAGRSNLSFCDRPTSAEERSCQIPGGRRRQQTAAAACGLDSPPSTPSDPPISMSAAMPAAAVAAARVQSCWTWQPS